MLYSIFNITSVRQFCSDGYITSWLRIGNSVSRGVTELNVNFLRNCGFPLAVSRHAFRQIGVRTDHGLFTPSHVSPLCAALPFQISNSAASLIVQPIARRLARRRSACLPGSRKGSSQELYNGRHGLNRWLGVAFLPVQDPRYWCLIARLPASGSASVPACVSWRALPSFVEQN